MWPSVARRAAPSRGKSSTSRSRATSTRRCGAKTSRRCGASRAKQCADLRVALHNGGFPGLHGNAAFEPLRRELVEGLEPF